MTRSAITMTIYDVDHYSDAEREAIIASYPEHEREARANGVPTLGSGKIFTVAESSIEFDGDGFSPPAHWPIIAGIDFGIDHYTAVAWLAWDREADCTYLYDALRVRGVPAATPEEVAPLILLRGAWVPVAWPADGLQTEKGSGMQLAEIYRTHKVNMAFEPARLPETGADDEQKMSRVSVEAGVMEMLIAMKAGRFKVAKHLNDWWEEMRTYHRKEGKIVREHDDLISAVRYAWVMRRIAIVAPPPRPDVVARKPYDWRAG